MAPPLPGSYAHASRYGAGPSTEPSGDPSRQYGGGGHSRRAEQRAAPASVVRSAPGSRDGRCDRRGHRGRPPEPRLTDDRDRGQHGAATDRRHPAPAPAPARTSRRSGTAQLRIPAATATTAPRYRHHLPVSSPSPICLQQKRLHHPRSSIATPSYPPRLSARLNTSPVEGSSCPKTAGE